jgi:predicted Zn-dependent peptidase
VALVAAATVAAGVVAAEAATAGRAGKSLPPLSSIQRTKLGSGLRVVTEALPALRSVTVGAWVGSGARDERVDGPVDEWGASHFLEHLLFKGTDQRSARDIAEAVECVGGEMNAFTTHEQTVFYVRVPDAHLDLAIEILGDVLWRPAFRADDVEAERQVILEEIGMRDDTPDDLVHDVFASALFPGHPLGREVLGSEASITAMSRDAIAQYHARHYQPANVVLAAAGNLTHDQVLDAVEQRFPASNETVPARRHDGFGPSQRVVVMPRESEQAHVVLGMRAFGALDPDRYALTVLNQALGGGMSSRLFQKVREERGLAYSVYSYRAAYDEAGFLAIYAGTAPERLDETLDIVQDELAALARDGGLPQRELEASKGHLVGSLSMSLETSASRMRRLGRSELVEGEVPELDEIVARVEAVQSDDIARVVDRVLREPEVTVAVVGPADEASLAARVA